MDTKWTPRGGEKVAFSCLDFRFGAQYLGSWRGKMAAKKKVSKRGLVAGKKSKSRTAAWKDEGRGKPKRMRSEGPLEPTEILTKKRSGEDRRPEEARARSEASSAVMDVEGGTWTGGERREGGERRILPDRRKTA
jgi:hypothetical protein